MEHQTRFDLNTALGRWRENLGRSPSLHAEELDEMEAHLRDATRGLTRQGLSEEEAFLVALRRLGGSAVLEPEFAKVHGGVWPRRLLWMLLGIQAWSVLSSLAGLCAGATEGLARFGGSELSASKPGIADLALPVGFYLLVYAAALAVCLRIGWRAFERKGARISAFMTRFFSRPVLALCSVPALLLTFAAARQLETMWLFHLHPLSTAGFYLYSQNIAGWVLFCLQSLGLAGLTLLIARRRLGIGGKSATPTHY